MKSLTITCLEPLSKTALLVLEDPIERLRVSCGNALATRVHFFELQGHKQM